MLAKLLSNVCLMKKGILLLFFLSLFTIQGARSQSLYSEIKGTIVNNSSYTYAYLVDLNTKDSMAISPIIDQRFYFKVVKPEGFQLRNLFLAIDSSKTIDDFREISRIKESGRLLAIEDMEISVNTDVFHATVKGGVFNKDLDDMNQAIETFTLDGFFESHPSSPVSLILLRILFRLNRNEITRSKYDLKAIFNHLSESLKSSEQGVELSKKIGM